jgi:hypothetical protein
VFFSPVSKFLIVIRTVATTILCAVFKEFIFMIRIYIAIIAVFVGLVVGVALNFGIGKHLLAGSLQHSLQNET